MPTGKILIVEDDIFLVELYRMVLEHAGFEVVGSATNGAIALDWIDKNNDKPDIVLMDYRMPVKNGLETAKEIRARKVGSHIILATADHSIVDKVNPAEIDIVLEKPFPMEELINVAKRMIGRI
ncbi:MAG TPA: response regulator [Candidatus Lokiarchaeia archaeon]|nr:response regulator [Candidatus Lokiarchaeia archaeon]